jgi:hypothetical protein
MRSLAKPRIDYKYSPDDEIRNLRTYRDRQNADPSMGRNIPAKNFDNILIASWKITNLGLHKRRKEDYRLIAEIISWFDVVAIQGCNEDGLLEVMDCMPTRWSSVSSVSPGYDGSLAFLFDSARVTPSGMIGELVIREAEWNHIKLPGVLKRFEGFSNPTFVGAFRAGSSSFVFTTIDTFNGETGDRQALLEQNILEAFALARWGDLRARRRAGKSRYLRPRVFISYSSDDRIFAEKIDATLERSGIEAWYAEEGLRASAEWNQRINDELRRCDAVIVLISKASNNSLYVKGEVQLAYELKKTVLAMSLDPSLSGSEIDIRLMTQQRLQIPAEGDLSPDWLETSSAIVELRAIQKKMREQPERVISMGQFNLPMILYEDDSFQALRRRGLKLPPHTTSLPMNVSNDASYGQIYFLSGKQIIRATGSGGVFDFDGSVFENLYTPYAPRKWRDYVSYYISAHRPIWLEFKK